MSVYEVEVGGRRLTVEVTGASVKVDGRLVSARLDAPGGSPVRSLVLDERAQAFVATAADGRGEWRIVIGADRLDVVALDERARAIRAMGAAQGKAAHAGAVTAPMPGLVVRVLVSEGERVEAGTGLIVIEAMKMENEIKAPAAGVVRRVLAGPGASVEKGAVLIEMEPG